MKGTRVFVFPLRLKMWFACVKHGKQPIWRWEVHLAHWGRDKMDVISKTTFSCAFSWLKIFEFRLNFNEVFFPKDPINNIPALVHIMSWCRPGDKPLSKPMMVSLSTHIFVIRPQWVSQLYRNNYRLCVGYRRDELMPLWWNWREEAGPLS